MIIKEKERLFGYIVQNVEGANYPPIAIWKDKKREVVRKSWRNRVKEILSGEVDYPSLYIHVPYCQTKCFYCKFQTRVSNSENVLARYLRCLCEEVKELSPLFRGIPFKTVYLAGGTPTIFSGSQLDYLFGFLEKKFNLRETIQKLIEATPASLSVEKIKILKKYNFNRLTIGIQTLDRNILNSINRKNQTKKMVADIFSQARKMGIENINLDLVAGLPGQTKQSFFRDIAFALKLKPDAIHLYPYEEKKETIFYKIGKRLNKDDIENRDEMIRISERKIRGDGYRPYRNEPYLLSPQAANLHFHSHYSFNSSILGLGAGALSYIPNFLTYQNPLLDEYIKYRINKDAPPSVNGYLLTKKESQVNYIIHNIRAGLDKNRFTDLFGIDFEKSYSREIESLRNLGRLEEDGSQVKLIAKDDFEFRVYSKFFFSSRIIEEIKKIIIHNEKNNFKG